MSSPSRSGMSTMEVQEWVRAAALLHESIIKLERKQGAVLKGFEDILREERTNAHNRNIFIQKTQKRRNLMKMELATIQQSIRNVCAATADPKDLQNMLEKFETKLAEYKLTMRGEFASLLEEEDVLSESLNKVERDIDAWEQEHLVSDADDRMETTKSDAADEQAKRIKNRQANMLEFHAKVGAIDRKVRSVWCFHSRCICVDKCGK